jgi:hypothetical protein
MAITNAQQYQQLVNKPANGKRPGYRGPGGYQGSNAGPTGPGGQSPGPGGQKGGSNTGPGGGGNNNNTGGNGGNQNQFEINRKAKLEREAKKLADERAARNRENKRIATVKENKRLKEIKEKRDREEKDRIIKEKKDLSQKGFDSTNIFGNIKKKIADYNKNYKTKQLARYQKAKIDELNSKLGKLGVDFYGDTEETYGDIITANAPSITEFGPEGTGQYSQQFIDDVLSGKRAPPESFQEIGFAGIPGAIANIVGPKISGPTTREELMDLYSGKYSGGINNYIGARDFDIDKSTGKEMMEIFEPNRFKREFGDNPGSGDGGNNNIIFDPNISVQPPTRPKEEVDDRTELEKLFDARGPAYRFFADGGRVPAMAGGIMNTDVIGGAADGNIDEMGRQMYFIGKLVKKASNAVKKIVKSPVGKIALLGAAGFGIPGTSFGGLFGKGAFSKLIGQKALTSAPFAKGTGLTGILQSALGYAKTNPLAVVGGLSALPFLFPGKEEEEEQQYEGPSIDIAAIRRDPYKYMGGAYRFAADGGLMRTAYAEGSKEPVAKKTMPLIDMDGKEMDLRDEGGFVPLGRMERADDVPARLSKNEFVFTADAVRNAGEGDIDKGAEVMYNMMKNLESGGEVSEESQGLDGAREMFKTSQRLGEVV